MFALDPPHDALPLAK